MAVMLEMLYFCLQAALHLDRHKRTLPAFSVLPMNLSPYLEYPRRTAQHAPADLSVALAFPGKHSRAGAHQGLTSGPGIPS